MKLQSKEHVRFLKTQLKFNVKFLVIGDHEPDAVDIINYTPGFDFGMIYKNSIMADFFDVQVRMVDIRDLIRNKELAQSSTR